MKDGYDPGFPDENDLLKMNLNFKILGYFDPMSSFR